LSDPLYGKSDTLIGKATHNANAMTAISRTVLGALDFGMSPILSRANMDNPGIKKIGADNTILDNDV
jgi:hypothetical protein